MGETCIGNTTKLQNSLSRIRIGKQAGDGNSRSGGAPEAVADLRAEAAAATEAGPPI